MWQAAINIRGKYLYLGSYKSELLAARAFDREAIKYRGNKARVNFEDSKEYFKNLLGTGDAKALREGAAEQRGARQDA